MRAWTVFVKTAREQRRDLWTVVLSIVFAPLLVLVYWLMTGGTGSTSYGVLVINHDTPVAQAGHQVAAGEAVIARLRGLKYESGSPMLKVTVVSDRTAAEKSLRNREAAALIEIPAGFSAKLASYSATATGAGSSLTFIGDLTNPSYTVAALLAMSEADRYAQELTKANRPLELRETPLGTSAARTEFENYVPGLLVLAVILVVFQAAMTPARDIESGALKRMRLSPITSLDYLLGTSAWLAIISAIAVVLTYALAIALGFRSQGPLWLAIVVTLVTSVSIIGIGLLVACFSKSVAQAFVIANMPLGLLMFLTGAAFPMPRMPLFSVGGWGFALPDLLPPTHAVIALNKIFTLGAGPSEVAAELAALTGLSVLYFATGVVLFQRSQMRTR